MTAEANLIPSISCSNCGQSIPLGTTSSYVTCSRCDAKCCRACCKTVISGTLVCNQCMASPPLAPAAPVAPVIVNSLPATPTTAALDDLSRLFARVTLQEVDERIKTLEGEIRQLKKLRTILSAKEAT